MANEVHSALPRCSHRRCRGLSFISDKYFVTSIKCIFSIGMTGVKIFVS